MPVMFFGTAPKIDLDNYITKQEAQNFLTEDDRNDFIPVSKENTFLTTSNADDFIPASKESSFLTAETADTKYIATTKESTFVTQDTSGNVSLTGNLLLKKPSSNYGNKINFGDGDLVHLYESSDDKLTIKASNSIITSGTNLNINNTNVTMNNASAGVLNIAAKTITMTSADEPICIHCACGTSAPTTTLANNHLYHVYA